MERAWTFGTKIGAGFAATVALALLISLAATHALRSVVADKDRVLSVNAQTLIETTKLEAGLERRAAANRGYLLSGEEQYVRKRDAAREEFDAGLARVGALVSTAQGKQAVEKIRELDQAFKASAERVSELRKTGAASEAIVRQFDQETGPKFDQVQQTMKTFVDGEERLLEDAKQAATETATTASQQVLGLAVMALAIATGAALFLTRTLTRQIGSAVQHVQSSSAELESAANQQATGSREQATALNEMTTTLNELVATARQIAESAQRVAHIAEDTAGSARSGDQTVGRAQEAVVGIRRQVDVIVTHMLDLGAKSQQIGGILEIINELAEQTNILSINATIEAVGAGEAGRRFAVVAEEIRKLADRVGGSTKEIRTLIEEIRAAVNATVLATESGSKAVDAGTRQFGDVAAALRQIVGQVVTTTEAAREIELSTKQQTTAVEQVNVAVMNVAQAAREAEASTAQTLQTATLLTTLSRELARLVQPEAS